MTMTFIKGILLSTFMYVCLCVGAYAQESDSIRLPDPQKEGGPSIMESFAKRASSRAWADKDLSLQDLSNLLWAANGVNRPSSKKRTAPSALNSQDVEIYIFMKSGAYLYDAANHVLNLVVAGDHRSDVTTPARRTSTPVSGTPGGAPAGGPEGGPEAATTPAGGTSSKSSTAAANIIMVSDLSKFRMGTDEAKKEYGAIDAAMVSENICLFCAGNGLATVPRVGVNKDNIKALLQLKDTQYIVIENAVGYPAETK